MDGHGSGSAFCYATNRATGQTPVSTANSRRRVKILGELSIAEPILTTIAQMTDTETVMNLLRQVPLFAMPGSRQTRALRRSWFVGPFSRLDANATQKVLGVYRMLDEKLGRGQHEDRVERIAKGAENTDDRQRSPSFRRTPHSRSV